MRKPCAYCGKSDTPRHKGHVVARSLYPASTPSGVQRPTVPECARCQETWTDAETQFRNIMLISGDPNQAVYEKWKTVVRSFDKPSGRKWVLDVYDSLVPIQTESGRRHMVYPHRDSQVNLVLRKIVRGLNVYHKLGECIPDERVWVGYSPGSLPNQLRTHLLKFNLGVDFLEYEYEELFDDEIDVQSIWLLRFYGNRDFMGVISRSGDAKNTCGPIFNPSIE